MSRLAGCFTMTMLALLACSSLAAGQLVPIALPTGAIARLGLGAMMGIEVSPDGHTLAVATAVGIELRDIMTFGLRGCLSKEAGWICRMTFSPDGAWLAYAYVDEIHVVSPATGNVRLVIVDPVGWISDVRFSPDGHLLAAASRDTQVDTSRVAIWDADTGTLVDSWTPCPDASCVAFSPDGETLAVGGSYGAIVLLDVKTGSVVRKLDHDTRSVDAVAFSSDGKALASEERSGWGSTVILWDAATGKRIRKLTDHGAGIAFSPDGRLLADGAADGAIRLCDAATGTHVRSLLGLRTAGDQYTPLVAFSRDGMTVLAGDPWDGTLVAWDAASGSILRSLNDYAGVLFSVAFSPDGRTLAAGSSGAVDLWNVLDKTPVRQLALAGGNTGGNIAYSPNGETLVTDSQASSLLDEDAICIGGRCSGIQFWSTSTWAALSPFVQDVDGVFGLGWSPDGNYLATGSAYGAVKLVDAVDLTRLRELSGLIGYVNSTCFSPDGTMLAAIDQEGTIKIWSVPKWRLLRTMQASHSLGQRDRDAGRQPYHGWTSLAFSPDGRWLASGSHGVDEVLVWDPASGDLLHTIAANGGYVMAFSPNGRFLAAVWGGDSPRISIVDTSNWLVARTLEGPEGTFAHDIAFSPDGMLLASASSDGSILLWDTEAFAP